jgi:hypothetical protein
VWSLSLVMCDKVTVGIERGGSLAPETNGTLRPRGFSWSKGDEGERENHIMTPITIGSSVVVLHGLTSMKRLKILKARFGSMAPQAGMGRTIAFLNTKPPG